ncbi:MAG: hypothetical protein V3573_05340 [Desulfovibrionaceae bacterium]
MRKVINIPQKLIVTNVGQFVQSIAALDDADEYVFDFSATTWAEPFGMLYISNKINEFRKNKVGKKFYVSNYKHLTYPGHMGFFQSFGLDFGKHTGEARGNSHYLPITTMNLKPIQDMAERNEEYVGVQVQNIAHRLSCLLTQEANRKAVEVLSFSFREILRNVFEHSEATELDYCAQYWSNGRVEISVLDTGVGIKKSLEKNVDLEIENDSHALDCCILPGVSGGLNRNKYQAGSVWENSGFGLYMANRLCSYGGSFLMCSGDAGVIWTGEQKRKIPLGIDGTAIRLVMNVNKMDSVTSLIEKIVEDGEAIAAGISGKKVSASKVSKVIQYGSM